MSSIKRAINTLSQAARQNEAALNRTMDRKDADIAAQKKTNEFIDMVDDLRTGKDSITRDDLEQLRMLANENGLSVEHTLFDLNSNFENFKVKDGKHVLELKDKDGKANKDGEDIVNSLVKKAERHLETQQGATGQVDLRLKMQLNDVTQYLQDANAMVQTDKDNKRNTALQA